MANSNIEMQRSKESSAHGERTGGGGEVAAGAEQAAEAARKVNGLTAIGGSGDNNLFKPACSMDSLHHVELCEKTPNAGAGSSSADKGATVGAAIRGAVVGGAGSEVTSEQGLKNK